MKFRIWMLGCLLAALPAAAQETSMAQAAEKQKKARRGDTKVLTEADLRSAGGARLAVPAGSAPAAEAAAPTAASGAPGTPEKSEDEKRAERKAEIEAKMQEARARIEELQKAITQAQAEMNDVSNYTYGPRRAGLQKHIDDSQAEIAAKNQAIADLQEQARREGIAVR
jgi:DNA repair exonuclease SbcCD ATPase subunit